MEHRWGHRLSANIPVRLRCMQSRDSGCRCLGCLESVSASGALIKTELGIRPAANVVVETLAAALGLQGREFPASISFEQGPGENRCRVDGVCINWRGRGDDGDHAGQWRKRRRTPDAHSRPRPLL